MSKYTGGCQCGAIRFEALSDPLFAGHCSCRDCQMASGTGHSTIVAFPKDAVKVMGTTTKYVAPGGSGQPVTREFCPRCGSRLFSHREEGQGELMVSASALDDPSIVTPQVAIFQRSAQPWDHVNPALPKFDTTPPGPPPSR
ncbi:MAG: GFA family protein [Alphaproteobacteria bacterium]